MMSLLTWFPFPHMMTSSDHVIQNHLNLSLDNRSVSCLDRCNTALLCPFLQQRKTLWHCVGFGQLQQTDEIDDIGYRIYLQFVVYFLFPLIKAEIESKRQTGDKYDSLLTVICPFECLTVMTFSVTYASNKREITLVRRHYYGRRLKPMTSMLGGQVKSTINCIEGGNV